MRAKVVRAAKVVIRYLGPVANAVHGELSKPEVARALVKALVTGAGTWGTMRVAITSPDTLTDVVIPTAAAALTGIMDAMSRLEQGMPKSTSTSPPVVEDAAPREPAPGPPP
jgi:hypothetical protein